jgi:hypothetical protein
MDKEAIRNQIMREPFIPFRLYLANGRTFDVPFRQVARIVSSGLLVFIGLKVGTHSAEGYDRFAFEQIEKIGPLPSKPSRGRRRKAS